MPPWAGGFEPRKNPSSLNAGFNWNPLWCFFQSFSDSSLWIMVNTTTWFSRMDLGARLIALFADRELLKQFQEVEQLPDEDKTWSRSCSMPS